MSAPSTTAYTWEELRESTLPRQFPRLTGVGPDQVMELINRVGPIQAQTPRAPFLAVSSRLPGASHAAITAAYESYHLVRGSSLRSTVHTSVRQQHAPLDAVARIAQRGIWRNALRVGDDEVQAIQAEIEAATVADWRTHDDLTDHLVDWLSLHPAPWAAAAATKLAGTSLARAHSALIRRPLQGGWHQQRLTGCRTAAVVFGETPIAGDLALSALVRIHLAAFGPATRRDIAWWTGERLGPVDAAIAELGAELTVRPGPAGLDYLDLAAAPTEVVDDVGVRLLPEFDATLLGYEPKAGRLRFTAADVLGRVWNSANGMYQPCVLDGGRLRGTWKLVPERGRRRLQVTMLPGEAVLAESSVSDQAAAVAVALDQPVDAVEVILAAD